MFDGETGTRFWLAAAHLDAGQLSNAGDGKVNLWRVEKTASEGLSGSGGSVQEGQQVTVGGLKVQGQAVRLGANPPAHTHT